MEKGVISADVLLIMGMMDIRRDAINRVSTDGQMIWYYRDVINHVSTDENI
jgi:hypothetical protein